MARIRPFCWLAIVFGVDILAAAMYGVYLLSHRSEEVPAQINSAILTTLTAIFVLTGILIGVVLVVTPIARVILDRLDAIADRVDVVAADAADHCVAWHYEVTQQMPVCPAPIRAVAAVAATAAGVRQGGGEGTVIMSRAAADRKRGRRSGRRRSPQVAAQKPPVESDPVPKQYLADVNDALQLGREIEAEEQRRRGSA